MNIDEHSLENIADNEEWRLAFDNSALKIAKHKIYVSNYGRIKRIDASTEKTTVLKQYCLNGYMYVYIPFDGKIRLRSVHRLVAKAFIPNPENLPWVNHKDEVKMNNHVENLEWCTPSYNTMYGTAGQRRIKTRKENERKRKEQGIYIWTEKRRLRAERNEKIFQMIDEGIKYAEIAATFGMSLVSIKKLAQRHKGPKKHRQNV